MHTYEQLITKAHTRMDIALDPRMTNMALYNARHAMMHAQNAWRRSHAAWQRAECADLIREADRVIAEVYTRRGK